MSLSIHIKNATAPGSNTILPLPYSVRLSLKETVMLLSLLCLLPCV